MHKILLILSLLIFSCDEEPQLDCVGIEDGSASLDDCGICSGGTTGLVPNAQKDCTGECNSNYDNLDCIYGNWVNSNESAYIKFDNLNFTFFSALTCSGIYTNLNNAIQFPDSCLNTEYSIELGLGIYSFKLIDNDSDKMLMNVNTQGLDFCTIDTLTRMIETIPCN